MRILALALLPLLAAFPALAEDAQPRTAREMEAVTGRTMDDYVDLYKETALKVLDANIAQMKKQRECIAAIKTPEDLRACGGLDNSLIDKRMERIRQLRGEGGQSHPSPAMTPRRTFEDIPLPGSGKDDGKKNKKEEKAEPEKKGGE